MLNHFLVPEKDAVRVSESRAREGIEALFRELNLSDEDARQATDVLIVSDLRGHESHGVSNMVPRYIEMYKDGRLNARPNVKTIRESNVSATWDADQGIGLHVGPKAMEVAMEKAAKHGIGSVAVQHCGHVGMLAYFPMQAIENDMIGVCMVSAGGDIMVPTYGSEPSFGTNPHAWGAPADEMPAFVFDVATTQVAANKLGLARRIGSKLEPGWICDLQGRPIMEKVDTPNYGAFNMLPFGGTRESGSHKGYGFAVVADIMSGILSGNGPGYFAGGVSTSQFVLAFDINAFVDISSFKTDMDALLKRLSEMKPAPGHDRVYYAGEIEHEETLARKRDGIPYHRQVVDWFNGVSKEFALGVDWP